MPGCELNKARGTRRVEEEGRRLPPLHLGHGVQVLKLKLT